MVKVTVNKRHTPGGGTYQKGDIRWVDNMPAGDGNTKGRPVIIVRESGDDVYVYPCTTKTSISSPRYRIEDIMSSGLDRDSYVIRQEVKLSKKRLGRKLGSLGEYDMSGLF